MSIVSFKNRPNECVTTTDGRKLWHSRSVAVAGVFCCFTSGEHYFVIEKRGNNPGLDKQGLWCLPCGYMDWDESGPEAMAREAWEEIGLDLNELKASIIPGPTFDQPWYVKTDPTEIRQNITLRYGFTFVKFDLPKLNPNNDCEPNEVADAKWIKLEELGNYEFAFGHDQVIKDYANRFIVDKL